MSRYSDEILSESKKLGIKESTLDKYYNRGLLAWVDYKNDIPGITPEALGVVVVEEFLKTEKTKQFTIREELKEVKSTPEAPKPVVRKRLFDEEFMSKVPEKETIREWVSSKDIQQSYIKRYGDKAEVKLLEAANKFNEDKKPAEFVSSSKPGSKRYLWELKNYEERLTKDGK